MQLRSEAGVLLGLAVKADMEITSDLRRNTCFVAPTELIRLKLTDRSRCSSPYVLSAVFNVWPD